LFAGGPPLELSLVRFKFFLAADTIFAHHSDQGLQPDCFPIPVELPSTNQEACIGFFNLAAHFSQDGQ
jgi:hypothetical protein